MIGGERKGGALAPPPEFLHFWSIDSPLPKGKGCLFTLDPFASFRARQDADDGFSQFNHYTAFRFGMTFR